MNRGTAHEQIQRGMAARRMIEDPVYADALSMLELRLWEEFKRTKPDESAVRESIYYRWCAVSEIHGLLQSFTKDERLQLSRMTRSEDIEFIG